MIAVILSRTRAALATGVLLAVPAFALWSLVGSGTASEIELARGDDPIRNGLRIVELPLAAHPAAAVPTDDTDEILLTNWNFTSKGKPSPFQ
jgi:hypothetical protein